MSCGNSRLKSFDLTDNLTLVKEVNLKRKRIYSNSKMDSESSQDSTLSSSHSTCLPIETDTFSDSEFEEHPYSSKKKKKLHETKSFSNKLQIDAVNSKVIRVGPSTDKRENKKSKCMSKNALMARINRQKKKKYIEGLESKNTKLEGENEFLKTMLNQRMKEVASLKREAINLQNVIRNSTEIGSLLKCIHQNTRLQISSSLIKDVSKQSLSKSDSSAQEPMFTRSTHNDVPGNEEALLAAVVWGMVLHILPALQADVISNQHRHQPL
uniref:BZIP domain-containing protein n=1 Tax=Graphocephala atropunctata TaxID=36148 RepID=A0A1B6LA87_9HEMI